MDFGHVHAPPVKTGRDTWACRLVGGSQNPQWLHYSHVAADCQRISLSANRDGLEFSGEGPIFKWWNRTMFTGIGHALTFN